MILPKFLFSVLIYKPKVQLTFSGGSQPNFSTPNQSSVNPSVQKSLLLCSWGTSATSSALLLAKKEAVMKAGRNSRICPQSQSWFKERLSPQPQIFTFAAIYFKSIPNCSLYREAREAQRGAGRPREGSPRRPSEAQGGPERPREEGPSLQSVKPCFDKLVLQGKLLEDRIYSWSLESLGYSF